ncbi:hypothetical protein POG14_17445 [Clostridium paraputrificum]|uniref:hypothetical protein n=1 Tax=Clostridium paraputrificum TaxID=29363 RepID=UPI001899660A|nr:hypothetical protein [Clostridium paraputrificum]MDC0803957.1 hypothetical protein [Clostridium paraputrificum]
MHPLINISKKAIYRREKLYDKALEHLKNADISVSFEDLGFIQCNATTGRKIRRPVFAKVNLYTVFKFYIYLGIVFRDKSKRYYTLEEAEQKIIDYYQENNIDYKLDLLR